MAKAKTTDVPAEPETVEPLSGDELVAAVENRRSSINPGFSSYDQGRHEELGWVLDQINPQPAEEEVEETTEEDDFDDGTDPFSGE